MSKKKKKGKKAHKKKQQPLQDMTASQLLRKGEQQLNAGNPRDAITVFKLVNKKQGASDEVGKLLFRAYLMREAQLRKKSLVLEADALRKQAQAYMPWVDQLAECDMLAYISNSSNKEAFDIYAGYAKANDRSPDAERFLASRLCKGEAWELAEKLDESAPLRRDLAPMQEAIPLMNQGAWEDALEPLGKIPRTSPFAPFRMFCRAMCSFYKGDDQAVARAISMLPEDFALIQVAGHLKNAVEKGPGASQSASRLQCLWDGPVSIAGDARELFRTLERGHLSRVDSLVSSISEAIYPQDTKAAKAFVMEIIWCMTQQYSLEPYEYVRLIRKLLPEEDAEMILTKIELVGSPAPLSAAGAYLSHLKDEFPDPHEQKIAHAFVLHYTAYKASTSDIDILRDHKGFQKYRKLLGLKKSKQPASHEMILIDMASESVRLDPENRKGYEFLAELPRASRPAKNSVENCLSDMMERFPDDPYPCLELAALFYEKNAFRKAETVLEEAMKRAPHDSRVTDRHVLALLISSDKNIHRGKFHLVERDMEKAEGFQSKKMLPIITEKQMLFQVTKHCNAASASASKAQKDFRASLTEALALFSLFDCLRVLALLAEDLKRRSLKGKKPFVKIVDTAFSKALKQATDLSSSEAVRLLMPLEKEYGSLFPSRELAPIFLKKDAGLLKKVSDEEVITVYDLIFNPDVFGVMTKDICRRLRKTDKKDRLILEFYLVTIQHMSGKKHGSDPFNEILDQAGDSVFGTLRASSRRLSKHASGLLKKALEMFEFDILDNPFPGRFPGRFPGNFEAIFEDMLDGDMFDEDMDDEDMDDDEFVTDDIEEELEKLAEPFKKPVSADEQEKLLDALVSGLDDFIARADIRGLPLYIVDEFRDIIRSDPRIRGNLDMIAELIDQSGRVSQLSVDVRIFLFGNKRKRRK